MVRPVTVRAMRSACSLDSAPPLVNITRAKCSRPARATRRAASRDLGSVAKAGDMKQKRRACSAIASAMRGWPWPRLAQTISEDMSAIRRPVSSHSQIPSARVMVCTGPPETDQDCST